ncbi:unnamed protein product [Clavelina lepadiformis]|uniref:Protein kinase domain-containing protein n=1 Tax=Clavelina lepadiformis TaxID=159417 RepID=A0ABP0FVI3_CLALP
MEYFPAGNLKVILLDEDIVLGPLLRARFGAEIANGLAFIHNLFDDKRLLHGDIKPENILLTEDLHCKIGDFGTAQLSNYTCTAAPADRQNAGSSCSKPLSGLEQQPQSFADIGVYPFVAHNLLFKPQCGPSCSQSWTTLN